jgi:hypothetical protein
VKRSITILGLWIALAISQSFGASATGTIAGTAVHRRNGTWLGIRITSNNFFVTFYDKAKNLMAADATSITLSWQYPRADGKNSPVLSTQLTPLRDISSEFTSSYSVPYPHKMTLRVILEIPPTNPDASDREQIEVYVVKFTGTG